MLCRIFEVNNVLKFINITISQHTLDYNISKPRFEFKNLDVNTIKTTKFLNTIGTIRNERCKVGVYI